MNPNGMSCLLTTTVWRATESTTLILSVVGVHADDWRGVFHIVVLSRERLEIELRIPVVTCSVCVALEDGLRVDPDLHIEDGLALEDPTDSLERVRLELDHRGSIAPDAGRRVHGHVGASRDPA